MKNAILFMLAILFVSLNLKAQTTILQEDFEGSSISFVSSSMKNNNQWALTANHQASGLYSDSAQVGNTDTTYLTSPVFSTVGTSVVYLEFDHIAKIEFVDIAAIEVSNDNGVTWTQVTTGYLGAGQFTNIGNRFGDVSYVDWNPGTAITPANSWWKHEKFNVSSYLANASQAQVRFVLVDGNANGGNGYHGWLLDNIYIWHPTTQEAAIAGYELPFALPSGCGLGNETIQAKIVNLGANNISGNLTVSFQREGQAAVTETVPNTILPFDTFTYTFNAKIDLNTTVNTDYKFKLWVNLIGDPNQANDSIADTIASRIPLADPVFVNPTIPYGTSTTLTATHAEPISWSMDPLGISVFQVGNSFTTPILFDTTTYYVQAGSSASFNIGPLNTTIGSTSSSTLTNHYMIFDVLQTAGVKIISFDIFPTAAVGSAYTIEVQDASQQVIATYSGLTTVTSGNKETVIVNFNIPYGTGYRLRPSVNPGFTRNTTGAVYPYTEPGIMSITGNTFNAVYAYYFYNWEVSNIGSFSGCPSKVKPITVSISNIPMYNAGVTSINSPVGTVNGGVSLPVSVTIKNYASLPLTKATINYSVNGVTKTPFIWTGNLAYNDTVQVTIGSETFSSGIHKLKAWTSLPNDSIDGYSLNDTALADALVCLSGNYTVGGSSADFADFNDVNLILNAVGICGPVSFSINDGTYVGGILLDNINGVSATNTIEFKSTSGDSSLVIITDTAFSPIRIIGTSYVSIKGVTVNNTLSAAASAVAISSGSSYNTIMNCVLTNPPSTTTTSRVVSIATSLNNYNLIKNNVIKGGYTGIYHYGSSATSWAKGNMVEANDISEYYYYGIYAYYQDSIIIKGNKVYNNATTTGILYSILVGYSYNGYQIVNNKIEVSAGSTGSGIRDYYNNYYTNFNASTMAQGLVANNFITVHSGTTVHGIYCYFSSATLVAYNSVNILSGSTNGYALYQTNTASTTIGQSFYNNNLMNDFGGYAAYFNTPALVVNSDNNNFYTTGSTLAYWSSARANLSALQSASGMDANSLSINPGYFSSIDLHMNNVGLNEAATPLTQVTTDIDGDLRELNNPDIGADEIDVINRDAGVASMLSTQGVCAGVSNPVEIEIKNYGLDTIVSCVIDWSINGVAQTSYNYSGSLPSNQSANVVIGSMIMQAGVAYDFVFSTSNPNGSADQNAQNDTLKVNGVYSALPAGSYTIGSDATDNWASFGEAVDALSYGICGNITINVKSGTYNEYVSLNEVAGASAQNRVIFQSLSGDSTDVVLTSTATPFKLNGADYITIQNMTISTTGTSGVSAVEMINGCDYNMIQNCVLLGANTSTSTARVFSNSSGADHYNSIRNNIVKGGYTGIYIYGVSSSSWEKGNIIEGNDISNFYYYGIYGYYQDSIQINGNNIHDNALTTGYSNGVYLGYAYNGYSISGNKINISPGTYGYGIRDYYNNYYTNYLSSMALGSITNNFVVVNSGTYSYGINTYYSNGTMIAHNSLNVLSGTTSSYAFYQANTTSNTIGLSIYNNNFVNGFGGYAAYFSTIALISNCDYNNYYTIGSSLAYWSAARADLAALKLASGKDVNSLSVEPNFVSNSDLHTYSIDLNDKGMALGFVDVDIDGDPRSATTPDIGADEFTPPAQDILLSSITTPTGSYCGLDSAIIEVVAINAGTDPIQGNLTLKYSIDGGSNWVSEAIGTAINPGDTLYHSFATVAYFPVNQDSTFNIWVMGDLLNDPLAFNDTVKTTLLNKIVPSTPLLTNTSTNYATSANLVATTTNQVLWYDDVNATTPIATGYNYSTPLLFADKWFYAEAKTSSGCYSGKDSLLVTVNNIPLGDLGISSIIVNSGCGLSATEQVSIVIYNQGTGTINSGVTARFKVDNGAWIAAESVTDPITSNGSIQFDFLATANLFANNDTIFNITAEVLLASDPYAANNILTQTGIESFFTPLDPVVVTPIQIPYGTAAQLTAQAADSVVWFKNLTDIFPIGGGTITSQLLFDTTTFYAQSILLHQSTNQTLGLASAGGNVCNPTGGGNMFDVSVFANSIMLDSMQLRFNVAGTKGVRIYYKMGSYSGFETDSTNWIYHDSASVTTTAAGQLASFKIKPLILKENTNYAIYAMYDANYASGANQFANADIQVNTGVGLCSSFGGVNFPRTVSGNLYYKVLTQGCTSNKVPLVVQTGTPPPIDAGIANIVSPAGSITSGLSIPVEVKLKNYGTDTLTSADIAFELDGLLISTYSWSGTLLPGDTSQTISITNHSFNGGLHQVSFWTSNANGTNQGVNQNDTMSSVISACLSGVYTLGSPASDYPTFSDAITDLNTSGICGDVIFKVEAGTYNEQITFYPTLGTDASNRIIFESASGDSTDVVIEYTAGGATSNWTVRFDGADFYTLRNMTIKANGVDFATAIEMINGANYNVVENNVIVSNGIASTNRGIYDYNTLNHFNAYRNNKISGGYSGIYVYGVANTNLEKGTVIDGNDISGFYYQGIYAYYQDSIQIVNNIVRDNATTTGYIYGINCSYAFNGFSIANNKIVIYPGTYGYGLRSYYGNYYSYAAPNVAAGMVYNNAVSVLSGTTSYGLYAYYENNVSYDFNTIYVNNGGSTTNYGLYQANTTSNAYGQSFRNNIFVNTSGSYAAYFSTSGSVTQCDYNNFYSTGANFVYYGSATANLTALQQLSGKNLNSQSVDPMFVSSSDLKPNNVSLNGAATPIATITADINGDLRNLVNPDMGAYEFDPVAVDAAISEVVYPFSPAVVGLNSVKVNIANYGNDTLVSAQINWMVNGVLQTPYLWTGSVLTNQSEDSVIIGTYNFVDGINSIIAWTSNPNNSVDGNTSNDTANSYVLVCVSPLKGVYTIGGANADFANFTTAALSLNYCGIDSAVIFNVNTGIYNEKIVLDNIVGSSAVNSITFQSVSGDSTDVVLTYGQPTGLLNATLSLNGTSYITFKNMTINSTANGGSSTIFITNNAHHNSITNCIVTGTQKSTTTTRVVAINGGLNNYNTILNSVIKGGYYSIYNYGVSTTSLAKGNRFENNQISEFYNYGVYSYYQDSFIFRNNFVKDQTIGTAYYPAYFSYCDNYLEVSGNTFDLNPPTYTYGLRIYYCDATIGTQGRIFNNNISINSGTGTSNGLTVYYGNYQNVSFNNVNLTAGGTSSRAGYIYYGGNVKLANNNFVTKTTAYTMYYAGTGLSFSDNNNFYTTGAQFAYLSTALSSLSAWQASSGLDANSISVDPSYYAPNDLHVINPALKSAGIAFDNVLVDIDGDLRSSTPDIGSDEFPVAAIDAVAYGVSQPNLSYAAVGLVKNVVMTIRNFGSDTLTAIPVGYIYDNGTPVLGNWSGTLYPGGTASFTFSTPFTTLIGDRSLCVFTSLSGDLISANDTFCSNFTGIPLLTPNYTDNFDGPTNIWATNNTEWQLGSPAQPNLDSAYSTPNAWMTNLSANYTSSSDASLYSPFFSFSGLNSVTLSFYHKYKVLANDGGQIQYTVDGGNTWILLGYISDPASSNWYNTNISGQHCFSGNSLTWTQASYTIDLTDQLSAFYNSPNVQFRFHFFSNGSGEDEGWLVDNFEITMPQFSLDAGITEIISPSNSTSIGSPVMVKAVVKNFGLTALNQVPVRYQVNSGVVVSEVLNIAGAGLLSGDTIHYTFATTYSSPGAAYNLCVNTNLIGDAFAGNNQLCKNVGVDPAQLDAAVLAILNPSDTAPLFTSNTVTIRIINRGTTPLTTLDVQYKIGNNQPIVETWTGPALAMGDSADYTFSQSYNGPVGMYNLCAKTLLAGDVNAANDEICKMILSDNIISSNANGLALWQNIPNPSRELTTIKYQIPTNGNVVFELTNAMGQSILRLNETKPQGLHEIIIDANNLSKGLYFYFIEFEGHRITKRMIVN